MSASKKTAKAMNASKKTAAKKPFASAVRKEAATLATSARSAGKPAAAKPKAKKQPIAAVRPPKTASPRKAGRRTTSAASAGASAAPTVLLVDDFPDAREMYVEYLEFSGFATAEASNGEEAIEQALARAPAVILMDLAMPVMDGWEATRRLKADPRTRHIPVIAVTGHALDGDAERARQAGCNGVIAKPCLPEDLVGEVRRVIAARRTR